VPDDTLDNIPNIIKCGVHSGFKKCCIIFFITKWLHMIYCDEHISYYELMEQKSKDLNTKIGYIPCPTCLLNGDFVKVIKCECSII